MKRTPIAIALAFAGSIGLAMTPAFAADTGGNTNSRTGNNAAAQTGTTTQSGTSGSTGMGSTGSMGMGATGSTGMGSTTGNMGSTGGMAGGGGQSFDKTGASDSTWNTWTDSQAKKNKGRVSRRAYMNEMGRRWDSMDHSKQGLTPAEVSRLYGNVDSAAMPAKTGSGVQAGNMGPGNQKGQ